jgi:hypothetical protein
VKELVLIPERSENGLQLFQFGRQNGVMFSQGPVFLAQTILAIGVDEQIMEEQNSHQHGGSHHGKSEAIPEHAFGTQSDTLVLACLVIIAKRS